MSWLYYRREDWMSAREVPSRKVLFLSHRFPYPPIGGDRVKAYHLLRHLSHIADVDLIALDEAETASPENMQHVERLANVTLVPFNKLKAATRIVGSILSTTPIEFAYYTAPEMRRAVDRALSENTYDLVISFFLRTAPYVLSHSEAPKILIAEDARMMLQQRATASVKLTPNYIVRKIDAHRLTSYEPTIMASGFNQVTFVSKEDEELIHSYAPKLPTTILTNGVDTNDFAFYDGKRENSILFAGHLGVYHNRLMAERLITHVYPEIRKQSDVQLEIVGKDPKASLRSMIERTKGAALHADVPDVRPYLRKSKVFVHPQAVGAGIQNKLLEAMSIGIPIITTPVGASGILGIKDGVHALIRESDTELAQATLELLEHPDQAQALAKNARKLIEEHHTWERIYQTMDELIASVVPGFFSSVNEERSLAVA